MMNSLSWFIYIANVLPNIQNMLAVGCGLYFIYLLLKVLVSSETGNYNHMPKLKQFVLLSFCVSLTTFLPSKETIYLIAGSEAGEYVVNTPEAKEIMNDIHSVIKHQLSELKGE